MTFALRSFSFSKHYKPAQLNESLTLNEKLNKENRAIKIANEVIANQAGILESATDDFIYNRGRTNNHWNNDFPQGAGHDLLIDFMKDNRDTRLLSAFTKNEFNGAVIQAFLDQGKEIPPYIPKTLLSKTVNLKAGQVQANHGYVITEPL